MKNLRTLVALLLALTISAAASADSIQSAFQTITLDGAAGPGMFACAHVEISLYASTADGGYIDFAVTNTSPRVELQSGKFANAFITEFRFDLPEGYDQDTGNSSVIAPIGVRFADGKDDPVIVTTTEHLLDWDFGDANGAPGPLRRAFMSDLGGGSKNVIFSDNALDGSGVPIDDYEEGYLGNAFNSGVFDTIIFRVKVEGGDAPLTEDDLLMYASDHLTVKYQGGEGSGRVGNTTTIHTPEPQTIIMIGAGLAGLAAVLRRRMK